MRLFAWLPLALVLFILPAIAAPGALPRGLKPAGEGDVAAIIDGDTLTLKDGRTVRLLGIQAPKLHDPRGAWPGAAEAKVVLSSLALRRHVSLYTAGAALDRHGRLLAHLARDDGVWIQEAMLAAGAARVYSLPDHRLPARALLSIEGKARSAQRGLWGNPFYSVRDAARFDASGGKQGYFELVRGRVLSAKQAKGGLFLDFGEDWRTDFSIHITGRALRGFPKAWREKDRWVGETIEARGWVFMRNGPMIEVSHPEQISGPMFPQSISGKARRHSRVRKQAA